MKKLFLRLIYLGLLTPYFCSAINDSEFLELTDSELSANIGTIKGFRTLRHLKISPGEITQSKGNVSTAVGNIATLTFLREVDLRGNDIDSTSYDTLKTSIPSCLFLLGVDQVTTSERFSKVLSMRDVFTTTVIGQIMFGVSFYLVDKGKNSNLGLGPLTIGDALNFVENRFFHGSWDATRTSLSMGLSTILYAGGSYLWDSEPYVRNLVTGTYRGVKNGVSWYLSRSFTAWNNSQNWRQWLFPSPQDCFFRASNIVLLGGGFYVAYNSTWVNRYIFANTGERYRMDGVEAMRAEALKSVDKIPQNITDYGTRKAILSAKGEIRAFL